MDRKTVSYKEAGVDTEAGQRFVQAIGRSVKSTHDDRVLGPTGGFSALYDASFLKEYDHPVLVSATDGVGTKLVLAQLFDRHESVGIDLVAMCANDLLVGGAKAHFFLDYIATGKLEERSMAAIVESIAEGCRRARCSLVGGETAEHPGVMKPHEYDLAGFVVGAVEKSRIVDGSKVQPGDVILGLPSSGIHSNGISLIRKLYLPDNKLPENSELQSFLRDDILLRPTIIYEPMIRPILESAIHGMVHVTGGGFYENVPRILSDDLAAEFNTWKLPSPFSRIQLDAGLPLKEMLSTFNCGYGYLIVVPEDSAAGMLNRLNELWEQLPFDTMTEQKPAKLGKIVPRRGKQSVIFLDE